MSFRVRAPDTDTVVFWDVEDFPADKLEEIRPKIKLALKKIGYHQGDVTIQAYGQEKQEDELDRYKDAEISFIPIGDRYLRMNRMMLDVGVWLLEHNTIPVPKQPNLMVISEFMPGELMFPDYLESLYCFGLDVFLVLPFDCISRKTTVPTVAATWYWHTICSGGGEPLGHHYVACLQNRIGRFPFFSGHCDLSICPQCEEERNRKEEAFAGGFRKNGLRGIMRPSQE